jgi:hypothetical protein
MSPTVASNYRRHAYVPPFFPPLERLVIGYDGSLWVQLRETDAGQPYIILNQAGVIVREGLLPLNVEIHRASATHVWAVETDPFDVQNIVRFRILPFHAWKGPN